MTAKLAEKQGQHYDGMLAACSALGGARAVFDYAADVRVLFDVMYPGVLPGTLFQVPPDLDFMEDVQVPVIQAVSADPTGALVIASLDQTPLPWNWSDYGQLLQSLLTQIGASLAIPEVVARAHGHSFYDNAGVWYSSSVVPELVLAQINAFVRRYEATPDAVNWVERNYVPTGEIRSPVLTLHNVLDPADPFFHENIYAELVDQAGNSDLLVQRPIPRFGHCEFTDEELLGAFIDLATWVETGVAPIP